MKAPNAPPGGALHAIYELAARHDLEGEFPAEVEREVQHLIEHPGTDDDKLADLTSLPFVTVDGPGTRDLDQALSIASDGVGLRVDYAVADAAYYVRPRSALFQEALRRGASFYLPGLSIPMLPRKLSEGLVSLNAGVVRRALVFRMHLDEAGKVQRTEVVRARLRSRAKLTFEDVDRFLEDGMAGIPNDVGTSLRLLRRVGELRLLDAERRDVPRFLRHETELGVDATGENFVVASSRTSPVESYNEQLSLLCNSEGARLLLEGDRPDDGVQPIYRVHPRPDPERMRELASLFDALAAQHGLADPRWRWRRDQSLAQFLAGLPTEGPEGRIATAMHRQAVLSNLRSTYSEEPGRHHGIGAEVYARFSAPMREIVGVFVHKELLEKLALPGAGDDPRDEALRARVVERAGEARQLQKRLTKEAMRIALDRLFEADEAAPRAQRPRRTGTVMGLDRGKLHVLLDDPRFEVKAYTQHLESQLGHRLELSRDGVALLGAEDDVLYRVGDAVSVQVAGRDRRGDRWVLSLARETR